MGSLEKRVVEATGGAERGEEEPEWANPPSDAEEVQAGSQRRWWKFWG